jgi:hypothetical protein
MESSIFYAGITTETNVIKKISFLDNIKTYVTLHPDTTNDSVLTVEEVEKMEYDDSSDNDPMDNYVIITVKGKNL